jgi:hypothetical protein
MLVAVKKCPATSATIRISKLLLIALTVSGARVYLSILTWSKLAFPNAGY